MPRTLGGYQLLEDSGGRGSLPVPAPGRQLELQQALASVSFLGPTGSVHARLCLGVSCGSAGASPRQDLSTFPIMKGESDLDEIF